MKFKILDLFSGAGGLSFGLELNKNFQTVLANDNNDLAIKTFQKNHPYAKVILGDITKENVKKKIVNYSKELKVNMIVGGPPCQGFSLKGKKMGLDDPRNFLFKEFIDIVQNVKPEVFLLENVKAMISAAEGYFIDEAIKLFTDLEYKVTCNTLKASNYGVPQNRERAFIIGALSKKLELPKSTKIKQITMQDAIGDLNYLLSGESNESNYLCEAKSKYQKLMRKNSSHPQWHKATNHSDHAIMKMKLIPIKGTKLDLPIELRTKQKFHTTWSRLHWDKPSPTIDTRFDTPSNGQNIHPILNRAITPREAARIQSFPDSFHFIGKKTAVCKQIGNAVPPLLAKVIGDKINKSFMSNKPKIIDNAKIYHADSYKFNINDIPILDAIITDPPYNISKKNNFTTMRSKRNGVDFGEWDKNFNLTSWIELYYCKLKIGGTIIIFGSYLFISYIANKLTELGANVKDLIKWVKTNPMPRNIERRYVQDTEFALWAIKPGKWTFNKGSAKYRRAHYSTATVLGKERTCHPTQKSLKLMREIVQTHTNQNDIIFDPFMGSGTTGVAALLENRMFIGIEKNKKYWNIAIDRISNKI